MTDATKALITGSVRTLAQFVPLAGGAVAQAWSEYETHTQNQRTEEFFTKLGDDLRRLQESYNDLKERVASMPDVAECLERSVAAAKRETDETKRRMFSQLYSSYLGHPSETSPDERIDLIHHLEQLSVADLRLLQSFATNGGIMRGDMVTGTVNIGWSSFDPQNRQVDWLQQHGDVVHSIAKLEARGLIHPAQYNAVISFSGESGSPLNLFRQKAWRLTPIAYKLLKAL